MCTVWTQRALGLLPSICSAIVVLFAIRLYSYVVAKYFNYLVSDEAWQKENRLKVFALLFVPAVHFRAPLYEELIFRGPLVVLFSELATTAWICIVVSGVWFAVLHLRVGGVWHVVITIPLGLISGYCGIRFQSIWASIACHFVWNVLTSLLYFVIIPLYIAARSKNKKIDVPKAP